MVKVTFLFDALKTDSLTIQSELARMSRSLALGVLSESRDVNIHEYRTADLRSQIGLVSQETMLFDDTIYENIRFGNFSADRATVEAAARQAQGNRRASFNGFVYVKANDWDFYLGDTIWEPIHDKLGPWRMTVQLDQVTVAEKTFNLYAVK